MQELLGPDPKAAAAEEETPAGTQKDLILTGNKSLTLREGSVSQGNRRQLSLHQGIGKVS